MLNFQTRLWLDFVAISGDHVGVAQRRASTSPWLKERSHERSTPLIFVNVLDLWAAIMPQRPTERAPCGGTG